MPKCLEDKELKDDSDKELDLVELTDEFVNETNANKRSLEEINEMPVDNFAVTECGITAKNKCNENAMDATEDKSMTNAQSDQDPARSPAPV